MMLFKIEKDNAKFLSSKPSNALFLKTEIAVEIT
jgi:hypothetical protein